MQKGGLNFSLKIWASEFMVSSQNPFSSAIPARQNSIHYIPSSQVNSNTQHKFPVMRGCWDTNNIQLNNLWLKLLY